MILKHTMMLGVVALVLMGCHEDYNGALYQYTVVCPGQSEPAVFIETIERSVYTRVHTTGYIDLTVKERHTSKILEQHEWTDPQACSMHKKYLGDAEPVGNDG